MPAPIAARPPSRATASVRSASRSSCARRSRRCRCSGWMPTQAGARAASRPSWTASPPRLPASSWAPRWSLRGTTSRTWSWPSSRTPTPTCVSRLPGRGANLLAGRPAGRPQRPRAGRRAVLVQTLCPSAPSLRHAASHDAAGFLAEEVERRRAALSALLDLDQVLAAAPDQQSADAAAELLGQRLGVACSAAPRRARSRAAVPSRTCAVQHW